MRLIECDDITCTSLQLPLTSVQVKLVVEKLRLIIPRFEQAIDEALVAVRVHTNAMLSADSAGLELNQSLADGYLAECEACMREQINILRTQATALNTLANALEAEARSQQHIADNATMIMEHIVGNQRIRTVAPDANARAQARTRVNILTPQVAQLRDSATQHTNAANRLNLEMVRIRGIFHADCDEIRRNDSISSSRFLNIANEVEHYSRQIQAIQESFCPTAGITNWNALWNVKSLINSADRGLIEALMAEALIGSISGLIWMGENLSFEEVLHMVYLVEGTDVRDIIRERANFAKEYFSLRGVSVSEQDLAELAAMKINDYRMMRAIRHLNENRFSLDAWRAANTQELRDEFITNYIRAVAEIMGLDFDSLIINLGLVPRWERYMGMFQRTAEGLNVWINPRFVDPAQVGRASRARDNVLQVVPHELRHVFQRLAVDDSDSSPVPQFLIYEWRINFSDPIPPPPGQRPRSWLGLNPARREFDAGMWRYMNQPIEIDAFAFGQLREWRYAR